MKYTIQGFSQSKLLELKLDTIDVTLLRYFIDFRDTDKMVSEIIQNEKYYWMNYKSLIESLPILGLGKDRVYRRFKNMAAQGILLHATKKSGGTFSYYAVGPIYKELIYSYEKNSTVEKPYGYVGKTKGGTVEKPYGYVANNGTKDSSIKDTSIKYIYSFWNNQKIIEHKNLTEKIAKAVSNALKNYTQEEINQAIQNYKKILAGSNYYFNYKWSLEEFLNRGFEKFLNWDICSSNFKTKENNFKTLTAKANAGAYEEI